MTRSNKVLINTAADADHARSQEGQWEQMDSVQIWCAAWGS